jgi:hypothetical protein
MARLQAWTQDKDRRQPKRTGDVTLHIGHYGAGLVVDINCTCVAALQARDAEIHDGEISVPRGAYGDQFHTKVIGKG